MVNPHLRGLRIGHALGRSYLVYAPKLCVVFSWLLLVASSRGFISSFFSPSPEHDPDFRLLLNISGYRASVFNLVYTSLSHPPSRASFLLTRLS